MMKKQKLILVGAVTIGVLVIVGGVLWFWHRSQASSIQVKSVKQFETKSPESVTGESNQTVSQIEASEETTEEQRAKLVADEKAESAKLAAEEKKEDSKPSNSSTGSGAGGDIAPKGFSIKSKLVSFGHESASGRDIDTIVLHSSHGVDGDPYDVDDVIGLWKSYGVAPHYMIARDGSVYQLVADKNIAYHAGDSVMPDGRKNVNNFSIGVEILNTKTDTYTSAQYQATKDLISYLKKKYGKMKVVGHDTIAPGRKSDPWNFDWNKI